MPSPFSSAGETIRPILHLKYRTQIHRWKHAAPHDDKVIGKSDMPSGLAGSEIRLLETRGSLRALKRFTDTHASGEVIFSPCKIGPQVDVVLLGQQKPDTRASGMIR